MKILAIMGSPHKYGNSYENTRLFEERLKELGGVYFEYVFLRDADLGECIGCSACVTKGEDACPLHDDRAMLEMKMLAADGVVFVTPVYNFHVTWLMKKFIDHLAHCVHRPRFFHKKAIIIVARGTMFKGIRKYLNRVLKSWGFTVSGYLGAGETATLTPKMRGNAERQIRAAADAYYAALQRPVPPPKIGELIWFRIWQVSAQTTPTDKRYWQERGWLEAKYYYPAKISLFGNAVAKMAGYGTKMVMKKVFGVEL